MCKRQFFNLLLLLWLLLFMSDGVNWWKLSLPYSIFFLISLLFSITSPSSTWMLNIKTIAKRTLYASDWIASSKVSLSAMRTFPKCRCGLIFGCFIRKEFEKRCLFHNDFKLSFSATTKSMKTREYESKRLTPVLTTQEVGSEVGKKMISKLSLRKFCHHNTFEKYNSYNKQCDE